MNTIKSTETMLTTLTHELEEKGVTINWCIYDKNSNLATVKVFVYVNNVLSEVIERLLNTYKYNLFAERTREVSELYYDLKAEIEDFFPSKFKSNKLNKKLLLC